MFELTALVAFVGIPIALGYLTADYLVTVLPALSTVLAAWNLIANPPGHTDEVDVLPWLWAAFSVVALIACVIAVYVARYNGRGRS
jgi:hypothetical protein